MRRLIPLLLALTIGAPAQAFLLQGSSTPPPTPTTQLLYGRGNVVTSNLSARFLPIMMSGATTIATDSQFHIFPVGGTIKSIQFFMTVAPTGSGTWTARLVKNGTNTAITCAINSSSLPAPGTGTGAFCADYAHNVSFAPQDWASWSVTPANSPTAAVPDAVFVFQPTTAGDTIIAGQGQGYSTTLTWAARPDYVGAVGTPGAQVHTPIPDSGTVDKLYVSVATQPGAGGSGKNLAFSIDKGFTPQVVTCSIFEVATTCPPDTTHSFTTQLPVTSTFDTLSLQMAPTSSPTTSNTGFGFRFVPSGCTVCFAVMGGGGSANSAGASVFYPLGGGSATGSATELNQQSITEAATFKRIIANVTVAPGNTFSHTFYLNVNGTRSSCQVQIANTAVSNTATCAVTVASGDMLDIEDALTAGATPSVPSISLLAQQ